MKRLFTYIFIGASAILLGVLWVHFESVAEIKIHSGPAASYVFIPEEKPARILFLGDMMFDRGVRAKLRENGIDSWIKGVEGVLREAPFVIGNLEGTITTSTSISEKDHSILKFTFDPEIAKMLARFNVKAVSLANNHSLDFGNSGFKETQKNLDAAGISYFGSALNTGKIAETYAIEGKRICLVGYHDLYRFDASSTLLQIEKMKDDCDKRVLFAHWGDEYKHEPNERQKTLAHQFIDAGADLVIGAHPHVVQSLEIYQNKAIFYSLGNFVFDQYFSYGTTHGLMVEVAWEEKQTTFTLIPITIEKGITKVTSEEDKKKVFNFLAAKSQIASTTISEIYAKGKFVIE